MITFMEKFFVAIGLVSEEIFPKTLFFSQSGQLKSFSFKKLKKYHLVAWIHVNVRGFDSL